MMYHKDRMYPLYTIKFRLLSVLRRSRTRALFRTRSNRSGKRYCVPLGRLEICPANVGHRGVEQMPGGVPFSPGRFLFCLCCEDEWGVGDRKRE